MIPKTISASSLNTADLCLARYKAENLDFTPSPRDAVAANIGTSVHGGLQYYVQAVYIDKTASPSLELLEKFYRESYLKTFDSVEYDTPEYKDGWDLCVKWFNRTDLSGREVLSVERKLRLPVPSSVGDIPMTYIIDRLDRYEEDGKVILEVVDYKTIRAMLSPDQVRAKLQARIYDLAIRSQYKDQYDEIRVIFDLLRHDQVGVIFRREEAVETWTGIKARLERIIATDGANPPETLNSECPYCVRKTQCSALRRNIAGGGIFKIADDIGAVAKMRMEMQYQSKGLEAAIAELDGILIEKAKQEKVLRYTEDGLEVSISARKTRNIDSVAAAKILGPDVMARYGKLNVTTVDKLIASEELTPEQVAALNRAMGFSVSAESVKVTPKSR